MDTDNITIGFIGLGNMATALIESLIGSGYNPGQICGSDRSSERAAKLNSDKGIRTYDENRSVIEESDIIFLCIKPQGLDDFSSEIRRKAIPEEKIFVSILAGVSIEHLSKVFGKRRLVRLMPNINCQVGMVAGGYSVSDEVSEEDEEIFARIASAFGAVRKVEEGNMDAITAVSGSGPAFVAYLAQSFYEAASEIGLDDDTSKDLVNQTIKGTIAMLESGYDPDTLIGMISSPNGTTVAGRQVLENSDLKEVIAETLKASRDRSKDM